MTDTESPQIIALKQRYKDRLAEKIELMQLHIESIVDTNGDADCIEQTHQALHKLAGSSGMYGYDDISVLCRKAMADLDDAGVDKALSALSQVVALLEHHR